MLFNSAPYAVMMATPADLDDFAVGFALAEGIITSASHIKDILTLPSEEGLAVDLAVDENHLNRNRMVKRSLEGRVGCGLCGIEDIKDAIRMPEGIVVNTALSPEAVAKAYVRTSTIPADECSEPHGSCGRLVFSRWRYPAVTGRCGSP